MIDISLDEKKIRKNETLSIKKYIHIIKNNRFHSELISTTTISFSIKNSVIISNKYTHFRSNLQQ